MTIMKRRTCFRLGCDGKQEIGIRTPKDSNKVILFCEECFRYLVRHNIISAKTGEILVN
jgi:hypothetical protein